MKRTIVLLCLLLTANIALASTVNTFGQFGSWFDQFLVGATTPTKQRWIRDHYKRAIVYPPYSDQFAYWYPGGWAYEDLFAIYTDGPIPHPEWILKDASGNQLYIRFACSGGTCPQYAGDIGNPAFRANWIAKMTTELAGGARGLYIDDVNMDLFTISNGAGISTVPIDPRTGVPMTNQDWRCYMAEFTEAIRTAFPGTEIVHNALWFLGHDEYVERQVLSADWFGMERGLNDSGITAGGGTFGIDTVLSYVDWVHGLGRSVFYDQDPSPSSAAREYGLAGYFLLLEHSDGIADARGGTPNDWWGSWDVALGTPAGPRFSYSGVLRRDFTHGLVLLNKPGAPTRTIQLGGTYIDTAGKSRTAVTLGPSRGAVLRRP